MDGFEVPGRLRQVLVLKGLPLIAVTKYGRPGPRPRPRDAIRPVHYQASRPFPYTSAIGGTAGNEAAR